MFNFDQFVNPIGKITITYIIGDYHDEETVNNVTRLKIHDTSGKEMADIESYDDKK